LLAALKLKPSAFWASLVLHAAALGALLLAFPTPKPTVAIARINLLSFDTVARTLSAKPTAPIFEQKTVSQTVLAKQVIPRPASGPISSPIQTNEAVPLPSKPLKIDFIEDAAIATTDQPVRLVSSLLMPDEVVPDGINLIRVRVWLNEAGQAIKLQLLNLPENDERTALLLDYLSNTLFMPFEKDGKTVAGVGVLELNRGGLVDSASSPIVTPELTAGR
jgi:hypothetical protein